MVQDYQKIFNSSSKRPASAKVKLNKHNIIDIQRSLLETFCTKNNNLSKPYLQTILKFVSAIFTKIFFHQMIALQKLWKMLFISSKKLFSFSRYSNFCISDLRLFLPVGHCFRVWSKMNLNVYDVINCLNKNSITQFVWYLEKEKKVWHWNFVHGWSIR